MMYIEETDVSDDVAIMAYLRAAEHEILHWRYGYANVMPASVPEEFEMTQIFAVIAGYGQIGAEGQTKHSEGAIERIYKHDNMLSYIHANVPAIVRCI